MIVQTRTFTRPSTNVNFFVGEKVAHNRYLSVTFQGSSPKIIARGQSISPDLLTKTSTTTYLNADALAEVQADATVQAFQAEREAYNAANGITEVSSQIEQ